MEATMQTQPPAPAKHKPADMPGNRPSPEEHTWHEEIEIASDQLVARVKELIAEGNIRRLIIRGPDDKVLLEVPLTTGVAVGGVLTILAPVLAALGAFAALLACVKIEIVRESNEPTADAENNTIQTESV